MKTEMENPHRKLSIAPPDGEAVARYTVNTKPRDVFVRRLLCRALPLFLKSVVKAAVAWCVIYGFRFLVAWVLARFMGMHDRIDDVIDKISDKVSAFSWLFALVFWGYVVYLVVCLVLVVVKARTEATKEAEQSLPEEYAFFETGLIYSNARDLIRVKWSDVRLVLFTKFGMLLYAGAVCDTLLIPPRYFCTEFPALQATLKQALGRRFVTLGGKSRDHEPMYENAREKIAIDSPVGEPIGELTVSLRFSDLGYLYSLWCRQIGRRYHRGLFGILFFLALAAVLVFAAFVLREAVFLPLAVIALVVMILYSVYITVSAMFYGKNLLVNRDYKKPVRFVFYPAGFLLIYENGVSHVYYEDLDTIFEDDEGMLFLFSKKQCLFLPARAMRSTDGVRLSHFFKASLFNLDPERGRK